MSDNQSGKTKQGTSLPDLIGTAVEQFVELTGKAADGVTGARREDGGGWSMLVDVVEMERIPDSTSILATYRVDLDEDGQLTSYERLRRYHRGAVDS